MKKGCCSKCQAKAMKKKKPNIIEESSDEEEDVKQTEKVVKHTEKVVKVLEKEEPKTDSKKEDTSDKKEKEKPKILRWQHPSTKKKLSPANNIEQGHGNNFSSQPNGFFNQPLPMHRPMMHHPGSNPSKWWPVSPYPRGGYPAFTAPPEGCDGPIPPYPPMVSPMRFDVCYMSPYSTMGAAFPPSIWHSRPDTNPVTRYTSYLDNYSYSFMS